MEEMEIKLRADFEDMGTRLEAAEGEHTHKKLSGLTCVFAFHLFISGLTRGNTTKNQNASRAVPFSSIPF